MVFPSFVIIIEFIVHPLRELEFGEILAGLYYMTGVLDFIVLIIYYCLFIENTLSFSLANGKHM